MRISVASGKGGTGKTLVATNLAAVTQSSLLVDLDVEEPNCYIFVEGEQRSEQVFRPVPVIDEEKCTRCGTCAEVCEYHAIVALPKTIMTFEELCHGCGACSMFCPEGAITEKGRAMGEIISVQANGCQKLLYGRMRIGEPAPVPLIRQVKKRIPKDILAIVDCPPGTACPAVESMRGTDFCVLVTEPTPFGFHDLKLALEVVRKLRIPHAVFVNKHGLPGPDIHEYCRSKGIPVVGQLRHDMQIARNYSEGRMIVTDPAHRKTFEGLLKRVLEEASRR
ncbi:MAG: ATP-binding protein [Candidatus Thermoplasmatota archaeon]|nr:ATP-binding protein [Candidatus Thermoplasmatota archaeon]